MNELFNTPFEAGLRILLILNEIKPSGATIDRIAAYDFMSIYGKDFGISEENLHGNNSFSFSELPAKRSVCSLGLKELALDGFVKITQTKSGFIYRISKSGETYAESLNSDYAVQYKADVAKVHEMFSKKSDTAIIKEINNKAVQTLRR